MPYATTPDNVKLYYEEVGQGTPILFIHFLSRVDGGSWLPRDPRTRPPRPPVA
jgi:proline iminopeptidase